MRGDNDLLSGLVGMFNERGYKVVGAHEVAPELVASPGQIGAHAPDKGANRDARRAMKAARVIGKLDAGQAAVVVNGLIVALEADEGTDGLLERVGKLRETGRVRWKGRAGVLAKCAKPQQDLRVDLPTIGVRTVRAAAAAGLAGIVVETGPGDDRRPCGGRGTRRQGGLVHHRPRERRGEARQVSRPGQPFTVFLIAGEESGDSLGAGLMEALSRRIGGDVRFLGVGGARMERLGLRSLFPMRDINHVGGTAIVANLPRILSRMHQAAREIVKADPDVYVMIDCPGFNLGVARRVRKRRPSIPIVDYVSPTVWVWRPRRAPWMAGFVDHLLAILPFEPEAHRRLMGPPCTYVGHPLIEKLDRLRPAPGERRPIGAVERPKFIVLPGSRHGEIKRLLDVFGETVARVVAENGPMEVLLPVVPRFADEIKARTAAWPVKPRIVEGEAEKYRRLPERTSRACGLRYRDARTRPRRRADGRRVPGRPDRQGFQICVEADQLVRAAQPDYRHQRHPGIPRRRDDARADGGSPQAAPVGHAGARAPTPFLRHPRPADGARPRHTERPGGRHRP